MCVFLVLCRVCWALSFVAACVLQDTSPHLTLMHSLTQISRSKTIISSYLRLPLQFTAINQYQPTNQPTPITSTCPSPSPCPKPMYIDVAKTPCSLPIKKKEKERKSRQPGENNKRRETPWFRNVSLADDVGIAPWRFSTTSTLSLSLSLSLAVSFSSTSLVHCYLLNIQQDGRDISRLGIRWSNIFSSTPT
jgi:hypothetical protein